MFRHRNGAFSLASDAGTAPNSRFTEPRWFFARPKAVQKPRRLPFPALSAVFVMQSHAATTPLPDLRAMRRAVKRLSAFTELEHRNWQKAVAAYDRGFGDLTRQCIPRLLEGLQVKPGVRLLDVATGPGFVAQEAFEAKAQVVATDFSAKMLVPRPFVEKRLESPRTWLACASVIRLASC